MQRVDIRDTMSSNGKKTVAKCTLKTDGTVTIQTDDSTLERQLNAGIIDRTSGSWTPVTPKDGLKFLQALSAAFRSESRWATKIQNDSSAGTEIEGLNLPNAA